MCEDAFKFLLLLFFWRKKHIEKLNVTRSIRHHSPHIPSPPSSLPRSFLVQTTHFANVQHSLSIFYSTVIIQWEPQNAGQPAFCISCSSSLGWLLRLSPNIFSLNSLHCDHLASVILICVPHTRKVYTFV